MVLASAIMVLAAGHVVAQPGTILELSGTGVYTPAEVDGATAGRFRNNGATPPRATHTVETYLLRYESTWPDGETAEITAQLFVPRETATPSDVFAFAPGSTGLVEACAPSRPFVERRAFGTYNAYSLAYAGQGMATIMPNYMGFFDVGVIQPYFVRVAEGRTVLDGLRAAELALARLGVAQELRSAFVGGYSQGGHAAFAAADLLQEYAPDVPLAGIVGFGPTTDIEAVLFDFTYVAPWVLHSYQTFFPGRIDPAEILRDVHANNLAEKAESLCIAGAQSSYPAVPEGLFTVDFAQVLANDRVADAYPELARLFAENDAGVSGHGLPAIILQGENDPVVDIRFQNRFVAEICSLGSSVTYPNYVDARHETRYIGFRDALGWMRSLAGGESVPNHCARVSGN